MAGEIGVAFGADLTVVYRDVIEMLYDGLEAKY